MVVVAQLVRALDCGSRGRRFETGLPPLKSLENSRGFLLKSNLLFVNSMTELGFQML